MAEVMKTLFSMCWRLFSVEITLFEYTITLAQVLFYGMAGLFLLYFAFRLLSKGGDGE